MIAYLFGLLSYFGWGAGDIFGVVAVRKIGAFQTTFWIMTGAAILFAPIAVLSWGTLANAPPSIIGWAIISGFLYQSGNLAINKALMESDASIALTIMGTFGAFVVLFSTLALHEPITVPQIFIIVDILLGIVLCTYKPGAQNNRRHITSVWFALYSAVCFGLFFTAVKIFTPTLSWFWPIYLSFLWLPVIYLWFWRSGIQLSLYKLFDARIPAILNLLLLRGGDFTFNIGLQQGLVAVVAPIGSASPTLSVLLAFIFLRERPTRLQILGVILALAGIVALGFVGR